MAQRWYQTIDDYALALGKANLMGPASTVSLRQYAVRAGLSNPWSGVALVGANVLALAALVALDPAGLRDSTGSNSASSGASSSIEIGAALELQGTHGWSGGSTISSGMVKDEEGLIIWT